MSIKSDFTFNLPQSPNTGDAKLDAALLPLYNAARQIQARIAKINTGFVHVQNDGVVQQTLVFNASTKLTTCLGQVVEDVNTWWNTGTSKFQPNIPGVYLVSARCQVVTTAGILYLIIYKNGVVYKLGEYPGVAGNSPAAEISCLVRFNGISDYIEIYAGLQDTANRLTSASATNNDFQALLLGP